jgi:hypothetical protein
MLKLAPIFWLLILLPATGWAQGSETISLLEQKRDLLGGHQSRLTSMLEEQSKRIGRLKALPAGVRRDFQLDNALRDNQSLATKLTDLRGQIRTIDNQLTALFDQAISSTHDPAARARLEQHKASLKEKQNLDQSHIITQGKASPWDSAEDLDEKADLLQDSEEKVRRQLQKVHLQLARLENRAQLKRHGRALEDNPFYESSARRTGQVKRVTSTVIEGGASSAPPSAGQQGEIPAPTNNSKTNTDSFSDPSAAPTESEGRVYLDENNGAGPTPGPVTRREYDEVVSIRDVMDPSILQDLNDQSKPDTIKARLTTLQRAQQDLAQMANQLSNQAKKLRLRAKDLRNQKK